MKILLTNDDGIRALGIWAMAAVLVEKQHEVIIVSPMKQQSGMSHALSVLRQLEFIRIKDEQIRDLLNNHCPNAKIDKSIETWAIDGTPTDCVKIYLEAMIEGNYPDLIISGINHGANLATDVLYSGTVGAALEGFLHEISSVAVSLDIESEIPFEEAAKITLEYLENTIKENENKAFFQNINFPKRFKDGKPEFKFARLGHRDYINAFQQHTDEKGRTFYRVGGQVYDIDRSEGTDIFTAEEGYIAVTPLRIDLTDFTLLKDN